MFSRWRKKKEKHAEGDPRGGLQDPEYRTSGPEEIVSSDGVAMTGPGGAPQDDSSPDERREQDRS